MSHYESVYLCLTRLDHFNSFEHIFAPYSIFAGDQTRVQQQQRGPSCRPWRPSAAFSGFQRVTEPKSILATFGRNLNRGQRIWPEVLRLSEEFREVLRPSLQWFSMYVLTVAPARIISKIFNPVNMLQNSEAFARSLLVVHLAGGRRHGLLIASVRKKAPGPWHRFQNANCLRGIVILSLWSAYQW